MDYTFSLFTNKTWRVMARGGFCTLSFFLSFSFLAAGTAGAATVNFEETTYTVGVYPRSVAVDDFNGDGIADLAVANGNTHDVSVRLGNGDGSFGAATNFAAGLTPTSVAVDDFDGDGIADLAVANFNSDNVSVLLGNGDGSFGAATNFAVESGPKSVAVGDFDGDGVADLVVTIDGSNNVSVLLGNGDGSFGAATNFAVGSGPGNLAVGDFNGDGFADLAVPNNGSDNVSVLLGNGDGSFGAPTNFSVGALPNSVAVGDFNGDAISDLAAANINSHSVSVLLGNGAGGFSAATNFAVGLNPHSVAAGDLNGDGKADITVANRTSNDVSVLLGNGAGSFGIATNYSVGDDPFHVAAGDFNGDGKLDIAAANSLSDTVSVLLQVFTPTDPTFSAATNFTAGSAPQSVAAGDFNRDGIADLAMANASSNNVSVLLGNGDGSFGAATNFAVGIIPSDVAVGDFNGDGKADLAATNINSHNVSVLLGNGAGGFAAATNFAVGLNPNSVAVGDFNRDGIPDLAASNITSNNVSVLLGNGAGSFGASTNFAVGTTPFSVAVGDFNGDGIPDLAAANGVSNNVSVLLGNGAGGFGGATNFAAGAVPRSVTVGDFNGDGRADLAVANGNSHNVSVLLGNGAGGFGGATNFAVGLTPISVAAGDFNGDGKADIATANYDSETVSVLPGNGAGSFGTATHFPAAPGTFAVTVGDFNGDGVADLATTNPDSNNVSVLLNTTIHRSAKFDAAVNYATELNPSSVAIGDFNKDGIPDVAVANTGSNTVSVRPGNAAGGFGAVTNIAVGSTPESIVADDFNRDGVADLVTANSSSDNVSVLLGNGAGGFGAATSFAVGDTPLSVAVGDFNGDGRADLATANFISDDVTVLLGNGTGGFGAATNFAVGDAPLCVAVGDFNGDGKQDLAAANYHAANVSVLLGNGAGGFGSATNFPVGDSPHSVAVGDFNGDGKADLATANSNSANVSVLLGNGAGGFGSAVNFAVSLFPYSIAVGDFDGDGRADLATANFDGDNVSVLPGNGAGSFGAVTNVSVGTAPVHIAVGDFNRDGKSDLATANYGSDNISILKNIGGQFRLDTLSVAQPAAEPGTTTSLLRITATHNGTTSDSAEFLSSLHLGFADGAGNELPAVQVNHLIAGLSIWYDADASGDFETANDTHLVHNTYLDLDWQGRLHVYLPANASTELTTGTSKTYFVVVQVSSNATGAGTLKVTHVTSASSHGFDPNSLNPLSLEVSPDISNTLLINEAPTDITLSNSSVNEGAANGTVVGTLGAVDPDPGDTHTFTLLDDAGGRFQIGGVNGDELQVLDGSLLDFETNPSHSITVRVNDAGGLTFDKSFTITVIFVNEAPTDITLSNASVNEGAANGTVVGTLDAVDPNPNDTHTFTLVDDAGGRFQVGGVNGDELQVLDGSLLDFETNPSHSVTIRATDEGALTFDESFTITVIFVNEAPTDITLSNSSVNEGTANGTVVGTLDAVDPNSSDTHTFTLLDNAGGRFQIVGNQLQVANGSLLDFETNPSHGITIRATDNGGLTFDEAFTITVLFVNEAPTNILLSASSVDETAPIGTVIGTLSAIDPNAGDTFTFSLTDNAGGKFAVNGTSLETAGSLDFETDPTHTITVQVTDAGGLSFSKSFTITVNFVAQIPVAVEDVYTGTEDTPLTVEAPGVLSNDSDPGNLPLTAVPVQNVSHGTLTLNSDGSFTYTPVLNFNGTDTFTYVAGNGTHSSAETTVSLQIGDLPDPDMTLLKTASADPIPAGQILVYTLTATNIGNAEAQNVSIVDSLPAGVTLVNTSVACSVEPTGLTCPIGTVAAGAAVAITIEVVPSAPGVVINTASVVTPTPEQNPDNNTASVSVTVGSNLSGPDLTGSLETIPAVRCIRNNPSRCHVEGRFRITNIGNERSNSRSTTRVFLSDDALLDGGDIPTARWTGRKLRPGQGNARKFRTATAAGTSFSGKYIIIVVDHGNQVVEPDESNNIIVHGPLP